MIEFAVVLQFAGIVPNVPIDLDTTNRTDVLKLIDRGKVGDHFTVTVQLGSHGNNSFMHIDGLFFLVCRERIRSHGCSAMNMMLYFV